VNGVTSGWVKAIFIALILGVSIAAIVLTTVCIQLCLRQSWPGASVCFFAIYGCVYTATHLDPVKS
jgi:hypothetical protein